MPIAVGTRFDRYQILSPLGAGGMGEIYLAQDTRLGRKVAIKLLPDQFTQDPDRLRRFEQEAYAASSLNHPNIITIYEIGQADGRHFIATEYIEGSTLRRRLASGKFSVGEVLDIAEQVVSALAAAHSAGIAHRDIKPENIMIRPDDYVKVLDFGLAKLTEKAGPADADAGAQPPQEPEFRAITTDDLSHETGSFQTVDDLYATVPAPQAHQTVPGVVMGTAQYMSPEQARGERVDARTDIFSFGIVLYELIAGRVPFSGRNAKELVASIINDDPLPLAHFQPQLPEVLEWIVAKALVKDRDERYQTAREMLNDLRRLQQRLGIEQELSRARIARDSGAGDLPAVAKRLSGNTTEELAVTSGGQLARPSRSDSLQLLPRQLASTGFWSPLLLTVVSISLIVIGVLSYLLIKSRLQPALPFAALQPRRFTASGKATRAAISPDGKVVVHVLNEAGQQSLLVRQVSESNNVEIVPPAAVIYRGLTFSRDGAYVYYVVQEQNDPIQVLYQVPMMGGIPRRILRNVDSPIALAPDNQQFAFVRRYRGQNKDALMLANLDGSNERELTARTAADFFGVGGLSWSPDGKLIACPAGTNTGGRQMFVAQINAADGHQQPISAQRWTSVGRVSWLRDGGGLMISATEQNSTLAQVWYLPFPKGAVRRVTQDLNDYRDLSLTDDSRALVTVQNEAHVNIWLLPYNDGVNMARANQITSGVGQYNGVGGVAWLPDNRLVYISRASTSQDLWMMDQDGKNQRQLTTAETRVERYPTITPDGRYVVFVSTRTGNSNLFRLELATGDQQQLTNGTSEEFPVISGDGQSVIYTATGSIKFTLWKVPISGGTPVQLTDQLSQWPAVSPDGARIVCWYRAEAQAPWRIAIIPINGGAPEQIINPPAQADTSIPMRWMPDGKSISFVATSTGVSNIWRQPLDGGAAQQLTNFTSDQIFWFDWSRDGKQLACSRGSVTSDVVLISEAK